MEKTYYDAASVEALLRWFEERYGVTSDEFYAAHLADTGLPQPMSGFHRHAWASFYRDAKRLAGRSFAGHAERVLAGAV